MEQSEMTRQTPANVLPPEAARLLQQAAKTPIPEHDPLARVKAIEKAIERIKRQYPQCFREWPNG